MTPEQQKAMADYQAYIDQFRKDKPQAFKDGPALQTAQLGASDMADVHTDPKLREYELAALAELEGRSKTGLTAADRAAQAQADAHGSAVSRGRIGAIQQSMAARGAGGTGMELVSQMQSAQDANQLSAMKALEREGMAEDGKRQAAQQLAGMSGNMQSRDFAQQAAKAQAADQIKQFNAQVGNSTAAANWQNRQQLGNMNTSALNQHSDAAFGAGMQGSQMAYNAATEEENRRLLEEQERKRAEAARKSAMGRGIGTAVGAIGGGILGTFVAPGVGTAAGAGMGASAGGALGESYLSDKRAKDDVRPEHDANMDAFLDTLEPKSYNYKGDPTPRHGVLAQDLERSVIGRDMVTTGEDGLKRVSIPDAISGLLAAVAHLNKKTKKG